LTTMLDSVLMKPVKQNYSAISVRNLMSREEGWGVEEGRVLHNKLLDIVERDPATCVFRLSLAGVKRTDVSFPREAVVELARRFRGHKAFCLYDLEGESLLENWDAAALKRDQPLIVWGRLKPRIIGPQPGQGIADVLGFTLAHGHVTASQIAGELGLKLPNASNKLRSLADAGYLLRSEDVAASGGIEFVYFCPK